MYEIWCKPYGRVSEHATYTDGMIALKRDAADGGGNVDITFTGGSFRDVDGVRYVLRRVGTV